MERVKYIWSEDYVGGRIGEELLEEEDRSKPFTEKYWSQIDILPLSRLREIQLRRLKRLLAFAWDHSPFYRRKWEEHGVKPGDVQTLEDFACFPVFCKGVDHLPGPDFIRNCSHFSLLTLFIII